MKQYLNFSVIITLATTLLIIFSQSVVGDFLGTPMTDFAFFAIGLIVALVICLITSNFAVMHKTKSACLWDCITDVIAIFLHIIGAILWFYQGKDLFPKNFKDLFPKNFISEQEYYLVFWFIIAMIIISIVEFILTLNNCLESMLRNGSVKVND